MLYNKMLGFPCNYCQFGILFKYITIPERNLKKWTSCENWEIYFAILLMGLK